jgi:hypothetical protein
MRTPLSCGWGGFVSSGFPIHCTRAFHIVLVTILADIPPAWKICSVKHAPNDIGVRIMIEAADGISDLHDLNPAILLHLLQEIEISAQVIAFFDKRSCNLSEPRVFVV